MSHIYTMRMPSHPLARAQMSNVAGGSHTGQRSAPEFTPAEMDPTLVDCTFSEDTLSDKRTTLYRVLDGNGRAIGHGTTQASACVAAFRTLRGEAAVPAHYDSSLRNCVFRVDAVHGQAIQTVVDDCNNVIGRGNTRQDAAQQAAFNQLRLKDPVSLSLPEFARLCIGLTVRVVRGKSGHASNGKPRLEFDAAALRMGDSGAIELRKAIELECQQTNAEFNPVEMAAWCDGRYMEIMAGEVFNGHTHHAPLRNGQHLIFRTYDAPAYGDCMAHIHKQLIEAAQCEASLPTSVQREHEPG